jgi:hypothetical protein
MTVLTKKGKEKGSEKFLQPSLIERVSNFRHALNKTLLIWGAVQGYRWKNDQVKIYIVPFLCDNMMARNEICPDSVIVSRTCHGQCPRERVSC